MKNYLTLTAALLFTSFALSQTDDIGALVTDRPDATESPYTVRPGFLQIETGGFYTESNEDGVNNKETTYNTTLLRYGLLENLELRLGLDFLSSSSTFNGRTIGNDLNGASPLLLGAKIGVSEERGWMPKISLIGHLNLPFTASSDFNINDTGMDFRFAFDHTLSERSGLAYNLGAQLEPGSSELSYIYTIAYGYDLTSSIGVYGELYGDFPENSSANHLWDAGFTYLANDDLQFDLTVGTGITQGQNLLLSAGLSYRIRKNK